MSKGYLCSEGWGWSHLLLLAQPWDGDGVAYSQQCCACKSIDVISNLFLLWTVCLVWGFKLAGDWLIMMSSDSLLFVHHVANNSCSHPQIPPPFKAHTLLVSTAHSGERESHTYSCTPVSSCSLESSLSAPDVSGEIEKKSVFTLMRVLLGREVSMSPYWVVQCIYHRF